MYKYKYTLVPWIRHEKYELETTLDILPSGRIT